MFSAHIFAVAVIITGFINFNLGLNEPRFSYEFQAKQGEFPYQVALLLNSNKKYICSGSLIDEKHVVTTAICAPENLIQNMSVWAGGITYGKNGSFSSIKKVFIHEKFNETIMGSNNIAVLRLETPFSYNENIKPIALPTKDYVSELKCTVSGWGWVQGQNPDRNYLLYRNVVTSNESYCKKDLDFGQVLIPENIMCAYNLKAAGIPEVDMGNPLSCKLNSDQKSTVLTGVMYGPLPYNLKPNTTIFMNVYPYVNWIKSIQNSAISSNHNNLHIYVFVSANILFMFWK